MKLFRHKYEGTPRRQYLGSSLIAEFVHRLTSAAGVRASFVDTTNVRGHEHAQNIGITFPLSTSQQWKKINQQAL
jgi:hypothetical protein